MASSPVSKDQLSDLLRKDGTAAGTLSYHPNLLVSQVVHGNGVTETQGNHPE